MLDESVTRQALTGEVLTRDPFILLMDSLRVLPALDKTAGVPLLLTTICKQNVKLR